MGYRFARSVVVDIVLLPRQAGKDLVISARSVVILALDPVDALDLETKERLINELIKIEVQNDRVERMKAC